MRSCMIFPEHFLSSQNFASCTWNHFDHSSEGLVQLCKFHSSSIPPNLFSPQSSFFQSSFMFFLKTQGKKNITSRNWHFYLKIHPGRYLKSIQFSMAKNSGHLGRKKNCQKWKKEKQFKWRYPRKELQLLFCILWLMKTRG